MFKNAYRIATVWGIPIKVHISLIVILVLFSLTALIDRQMGPLAAVLILAVMVLIFLSVALHELGHSFVALRKGCRVRQITLTFLGGMAQMDRLPARPRDEFLVAIAGPAVSGILAALGFWAAGALEARGWPLAHLVFLRVGWVNLMLMLFNLLPSFPMDGGRIFRAALTPRLGRVKATYIASRLGRILAVLFGIYGFWYGEWILVAIAFFIYSAAGQEYEQILFQEQSRSGHGWSPLDSIWRDDTADADDQVVISPPPYERGPERRVDISPGKNGRR